MATESYEITWKTGRVETAEADSVLLPYSPREGAYVLGKNTRDYSLGHFRFFKNLILVLSIAESEIKSVRLIQPTPASGFVKKKFDQREIEVEQRWLDRAKELLWIYGTISTEPAKILTREMGLVPHSTDMPYVLVVLANGEICKALHKH